MQSTNTPSVVPCADSTAPNIPGSLTPTVVAHNQIALSWPTANDPSGQLYERVSGVKAYQIFRGGMSPINQIAEVPYPGTGFADNTVAGNTTYSYAIRTVDNNNNVSDFQSSTSVTTPFALPDAPTGLAGNATSCSAVQLEWVAPTFAGSGLAYYNVYRDNIFLAQSFSTALTDNNVTSTTYNYAVRAVDTGGRESASSASIFVIVPVCPVLPASNLQIEVQDNLANVRWNGTPGTLYQAECAPGFFGPWMRIDAPTATFAATNIAVMSSSIYRVAIFTNTPAYLANYVTNQADTAAPTAPGNLQITAVTETEAALTWDPVSDVGTPDGLGNTFTSGLDRYLIYRDGAFLKSRPVTSTSATDTTAVPETQYTYSVAAIDKAGNRSGLTSGSILVRRPCNYDLSSYWTSFDAWGGGGNLSVLAVGEDCSWAASPAAGWIHSTSAGNGNGNVSFQVDANPSAIDRAGILYIAGKIFTINQTGLPCTYAFNPASQNHGAAAGLGSFDITVPAGCSWSASSGAEWILTSSSGSGNGTVNYSVTENTGAATRTGTISAGGQSFTVIQLNAASCVYTLSPPNSAFWSAGGSGSFAVTTDGGCNWNASTTDPWIHTSANGAGSGTANFSVDPNPNLFTRSGTIVAGGQTFSIFQGQNQAPLPSAGTDLSVAIGAQASFSAVESIDPDGNIVSYDWDFGDGTTGVGMDVSHAYGVLGVYTVRLRVTDDLGVTATDTALVTILALPDLIKPTVSLSIPGSPNCSGTINLNATANDNVAVAKVEFLRDGTLFSTSTSPPYGAAFDTRSLGNGSHSFTAKAYDAANNTEVSTVTVLVDNAAPTAVLTAPSNGNVVSNTITLSANASDNAGGSGLVRVEFYCGSQASPLNSLTTAPYSVGLDTKTLPNGSQTFYCKAFDAAGNSVSSANVTVTINNTLTTPAQFVWAKQIVGPTASADVQAKGIAIDSAGNSIVAGFFADSVDFGAGTVRSRGGYDAFIVKYSASGAYMWARQLGGDDTDYAKGVAVDSAGNIYIHGQYQSSNLDLGFGPVATVGASDLYLLKLSPSGTPLWVKTFSGTGIERAYSVTVDTHDNVLITGGFAMYGTPVDFGTGPLGSLGQSDIYVAKYTPAGTAVWAKRFGSDGDDFGTTIAVDRRDDGIVMAGQFQGAVNFGGATLSSGGGNDIFMLKLSSNGTHAWSKRFGDTGNDQACGVRVDDAGNIAMVGNFMGTVNFGGGAMTFHGQSDMFIARFNETGSCLWSKGFGTAFGGDALFGVTTDASGNVIVTGMLSGFLDLGGGWMPVTGGQDILMAKFSPSGDHVWSRRYGGYGYDYGYGVATDNAGNVFGAGYFVTSVDFGGGQMITGGWNNGYIVKFTP